MPVPSAGQNPLTLDRDSLCVAGIHVGARRSVLAIADLGGRTLYSHAVATPAGPAKAAVEALCAQLKELADRFSGRRLIWGGRPSAGPSTSTPASSTTRCWAGGTPRSGRFWPAFSGSRCRCANTSKQMAAAELLLLTHPVSTVARDFSSTRVKPPAWRSPSIAGCTYPRGAGTIAHLPVNAPVIAGGYARLQQVIGRTAARTASELRGIPVTASPIVDERARVLGESVALLRDVINPDSIVVAGTPSPPPRRARPGAGGRLQRGDDDELGAGDHTVEIRCAELQESAAVVVALSVLYADPVAAVV